MRRFFFVTAIAAFISALSVLCGNFALTVTVCIFAVVLFSASVILYKKLKLSFLWNTVCLSVAILLFCGSFNLYNAAYIERYKVLDGKTCNIKAKIVEEPQVKNGVRNKYTVYVADVFYVDNPDLPQSFRIKINANGANTADHDDIVSGQISLYLPDEDYLRTSYSDGIKICGYFNGKSYAVEKAKSYSFYGWAIELRRYIRKIFLYNLDEDIGGIPIALITGDKGYISNEFYGAVKMTGMSHTLAVSGLHITVIVMTIVNLLQRLKFGRRFSSFGGIIVLFALAAVAGFSGSIMRAGIMHFVFLTARALSRRADGLNSLGLAATIQLAVNPYNIFNISFMLSTFSTLGILLFAAPLAEKLNKPRVPNALLNKLYRYFTASLSVTLSAQIFILPFSLSYFGYISTLSPIVNILLSPVITLSLLLPLVMLITAFIPFVFGAVAFVTTVVITVFRDVILFFGSFSYCGFKTDDIMLFVYATVAFAVVVTAIIFRKKAAATAILLSALVVLIVPFQAIQHTVDARTVKYTFFKAESGICMTVENGGKVVVITTDDSASTASAINSYLSKRNIGEIYALILPFNDDDTNFVAEKRLSSKRDIKHTLSATALTDNRKLSAGIITLFERVKVDVLSRENSFDLVIDSGETVLFDTLGCSSYTADIILTANPILSYKINGTKPRYIVSGDDNSVYADYIRASGCRAAELNKSISATVTEKGLKFA